MGIVHHPSPNFGPRRGDGRIGLVVLHYTAMESTDAALARLCDPLAEVSCHYLIGRDGTVFQLVAEDQRAWHAGAGRWGALDDVNSHSIGVELCNPGGLAGMPPFPSRQMTALIVLLAEIRARHGLPSEAVIGHSDMAPERKADPGPAFDWRGLALAAQSVWATGMLGPGKDGPPSLPRFRRAACRFGYGPDGGDAALLQAFRLRFAPQRLGQELGWADIHQAEALAAAYPCIDAALPSA